MPDDAREFGTEPDIRGAVRYVRARGRFVLAACGLAAVVALAVSLALPKQYTAVCRILIEPPGGSDVRATTAVSPVYLESLRTYELFAASDDLFRRAVERFGLRGSAAIGTLKKRVLKVEIPRNTKVMEIYATLPDARKAHDLALFLGRETVELTRAASMGGERERIAAAEREAAAAGEQYDRAGQAWADAITRGPVDPLSAELDADLTLRARLLRQFATAEADPQDPRGAILRRQVAALDKKIAAEQKTLGERSGSLARLDAERRSMEAEFRAARQRLHETRSAVGMAGERLSVIDPGVVPERPSSPKVLLNVAVAVAAALVLSLLWLLAAFGWSAPAMRERYAARTASRHD